MQSVPTLPRQWPQAAARPSDQGPGKPKFQERFSIATVDFASEWDLPSSEMPTATVAQPLKHEVLAKRGLSTKKDRSCLPFASSFFSSLLTRSKFAETSPPSIPLEPLQKPLPPLPQEPRDVWPVPHAPAVPPCALVRSKGVRRGQRAKENTGLVFAHALNCDLTHQPGGEADGYYQDHPLQSSRALLRAQPVYLPSSTRALARSHRKDLAFAAHSPSLTTQRVAMQDHLSCKPPHASIKPSHPPSPKHWAPAPNAYSTSPANIAQAHISLPPSPLCKTPQTYFSTDNLAVQKSRECLEVKLPRPCDFQSPDHLPTSWKTSCIPSECHSPRSMALSSLAGSSSASEEEMTYKLDTTQVNQATRRFSFDKSWSTASTNSFNTAHYQLSHPEILPCRQDNIQPNQARAYPSIHDDTGAFSNDDTGASFEQSPNQSPFTAFNGTHISDEHSLLREDVKVDVARSVGQNTARLVDHVRALHPGPRFTMDNRHVEAAVPGVREFMHDDIRRGARALILRWEQLGVDEE